MSDLYRDDLMEIYKNPTRKKDISDPSAKVFKKNPMCGDEINLMLKIEKDVIIDASFSGSACSVSIISSELLLSYIIGKKISEVKNIKKDDLLKLLDLNLSTSRIACATLVLNALQKAIEDYENGKQNK